MKPYYSEGGITIYHGDCRDILTGLRLGDSRVVITDPPYNVGLQYGPTTNDTRSDYEEWCREWFSLTGSVAHLIAITPGIANIRMWYRIEEPYWVMAWHKPAAMRRAPLGFNNWEPVLIYGKPKTAPCVDVVTAPIIPDISVEGHPCPKPLAWAKGLIRSLASSSDVVVDPFCGSGTTMRAALDMGHRAIGIEIEERYCEIAAKRLSQGALPLDMPMEPQGQCLWNDSGDAA